MVKGRITLVWVSHQESLRPRSSASWAKCKRRKKKLYSWLFVWEFEGCFISLSRFFFFFLRIIETSQGQKMKGNKSAQLIVPKRKVKKVDHFNRGVLVDTWRHCGQALSQSASSDLHYYMVGHTEGTGMETITPQKFRCHSDDFFIWVCWKFYQCSKKH